MKKFIFTFLLINLIGCSNPDDGNTILPNVPVNFTINLNLPAYQDLLINNGSYYEPGEGIKGVIIFRFSENSFYAWDAACPHIPPNECSTMYIEGVKMICPCDNTEFSILDGAPLSGTQFSARQYNVVKNGNILTITRF